MTTLADKAILSGADNCPLMLEKDMYDSWKSIMELYPVNRQHGRMILEFIENGLKDNLRKLKGKFVVDEAVISHPIDPKMLKVDVAPLAPKLRNNRIVHSDYLKHTQEETVTLREIVEHERSLNPLNTSLDYVCLKDNLRKLKGKFVVDEAVISHPIDPKMLKVDVAPLAPKLRNNRIVHSDYLKHTQEETVTLREIVEHERSLNNRVQFGSGWVLSFGCSSTTGIQYSFWERCVPLPQPKGDDPIDSINHMMSFLTDVVTSRCSKHMTEDRSQLTNFVNKFLGMVKFGNDHVAKIMAYGDYQIGNITISRVYFVEGLGHNLFFVREFYDSNLEVAFRQHTCFIRNLEGVDLLSESRGNNLYTPSLEDMMKSSPICLLSKTSKTKSWLWHQRLCHLNFGAINHLARQGLVRGLLKLKFEKDHLCSVCAMGKSKKKSYKPKSEDTNQEKLYLLHMDLYGPMHFKSVGIPHEIFVARSAQQNGVVERRNRTLIEAARTMLIYARASLFLWAEAVATACFTQNCFILRLRHGNTPYELLHNKLPDLSYFHVFGALCYSTNDSENLGKLQPKADI
nr:hypothetical protein [Tanacetum cinerariifolium]